MMHCFVSQAFLRQRLKIRSNGLLSKESLIMQMEMSQPQSVGVPLPV